MKQKKRTHNLREQMITIDLLRGLMEQRTACLERAIQQAKREAANERQRK